MEQEICKRTLSQSKKNYKLPIILSLSWIVISFMINCIIGGGVTPMFQGGLYWIGFGNMILGLVLALIFWLLSLPANITLVLTDERIYCSYSKTLLFSRRKSFVVSYPLNKIVSYDFYMLSKKGKPCASSLSFSTPASKACFAADEEFYNEFVKATNSTKSKE